VDYNSDVEDELGTCQGIGVSQGWIGISTTLLSSSDMTPGSKKRGHLCLCSGCLVGAEIHYLWSKDQRQNGD
jgi:hypothetical protein